MATDGGANERILDTFTRNAIDLQRVEAGQRRRILAILRDLEGELVAQLARVDPTGVTRTAARQARLEKLQAQVKDTIRAAYRSAGSVLRGELRELADIEAQFAARAINQGVGFALASGELTRQQVSSLVDGVLVQGSPVGDWWSRQAGDTLERFTDAMRLGIAEGETNAQLIRRIRGGTQNGEPVQGFMEITRRHAESLVRSATQAAASAAKDETYRQNADIIKGVMWVSTLDGRTTLGCAARDGLLYTVGDHQPIDHDLPWEGGPGNRHWGCRSTSAPVTKSWRELGLNIDDLPPGTRASMDGQVPADTTFDGWLSRQPKAVQDDMLGPGRADLWRENKLGMRDLLDANGRELSLAELRARI